MSSASPANIVERLAGLPIFAEVPLREIEWLAAHGTLEVLGRGDAVIRQGQPTDRMYIILSGRLVITVYRGGAMQRVMEWPRGEVSGVLPYSRVRNAPGDIVAAEPTEMWMLHRTCLPDLIRECHDITSVCVHKMLDRARQFTSADLQTEKMASLGKLAAGLAHELNNPASAVARNAQELHDAVQHLEAAARGLGASGLTADQIATVDELRARCAAPNASAASALEQSDWEETLEGWLEDHAVDVGLAGPLAGSSAALEDLDALAGRFRDDQLRAALTWIAAGCQVRQLVAETETAAARIHFLVAAVKGFTHMDQAASPALVDLAKGLQDTRVVLASRARAKSVRLTVDVAPDVPRVEAVGGELNQVWANLLENALDAVGQGGEIAVTVAREGPDVVVRVVDDGPGIPADIRSRVFEPFFTTKPVGQGTGLGLDIARRLVLQSRGSIDVQSEPGRTEFRVTLPAAVSTATEPSADVRS